MNELSDLNREVTAAIFHAEAFPTGTRESEEAFIRVSELEARIADITGVRSIQGEIARVGAVLAAVSARAPARALLLVERYRAQDLSPGIRARVENLAVQAQSLLSDEAST